MLKDHPADLARSGNRSCHPRRNLAAIRPAGKAAQRDADPLGGSEEALRGGVKSGRAAAAVFSGPLHAGQISAATTSANLKNLSYKR